MGHYTGKWLVPDLAMVGAAVTLLFALFLFDGGEKLFRDSDTGWHIRTGETILATGVLPRSDPYSWTQAGKAWVAWEWGADVLMGAVHREHGVTGVALLYLMAIAACTWLWFRLHWIAGGDFLIACAMASPMLSTVNIHWLARPHVFGWVFLLAWISVAERSPRRFLWWHALAAAAGSALWANMHASFFLLPLTCLLYAAGHLLRRAVWKADPSHGSPEKWFAGIALFAGVGSLLNPYGWRLHFHVWEYLRGVELLARIGEFQSFNFHSEGAFQILLCLALAGMGAVLALSQGKVAQFLLMAGLAATGLRSARGLPLVALLALPLANGALTQALASAQGLRPGLRRRLDQFLQYSGNLRRLEMGFRGYAAAPALLVLAFVVLHAPAMRARTGFPADQFPVQAAAAVERLPAGARILHPDKFGGYLIYRFSGQRKVFFDGRSDLYGLEFMKRYIRLVQVRPGWEEHIRYYGFTHALLPNDYSLAGVLEARGWKKLHKDSTAILLGAPEDP
ncbi:MAG: hypothetical protein JJE04_27660 [Acidobacteriia bacterium]|nr:hypothetical protein [Terriglobia bacterium]